MRWALGASEICFTNDLYARFFARGRVVPVIRGNGVYQPSMDFVIKKLNSGGWVHVFPEGINLKYCLRCTNRSFELVFYCHFLAMGMHK